MTTFPSGHQTDSDQSHHRILETNLGNHTGRPHGHSAFKTYTAPLLHCAELYAVVGRGSFNNTATKNTDLVHTQTQKSIVKTSALHSKHISNQVSNQTCRKVTEQVINWNFRHICEFNQWNMQHYLILESRADLKYIWKSEKLRSLCGFKPTQGSAMAFASQPGTISHAFTPFRRQKKWPSALPEQPSWILALLRQRVVLCLA